MTKYAAIGILMTGALIGFAFGVTFQFPRATDFKILPPDTGLNLAVADEAPGWWSRNKDLYLTNATDSFWLRRVWTNDNIYEVWRMQ